MISTMLFIYNPHQFVEKHFPLRTPQTHSHHYDLIENNPELWNHYSKVFGVNYRSALESLPYFSVPNGSMIPDIMHDVLEGLLPLEINNLLKVLGAFPMFINLMD